MSLVVEVNDLATAIATEIKADRARITLLESVAYVGQARVGFARVGKTRTGYADNARVTTTTLTTSVILKTMV